jgi:hypothetical protein
MLPELNPIMAPDAYCSMCGEKMTVTQEKGPNGKLHQIVYTCSNEKTGCSYQIHHDQRLTGMATRVK